MGSNLSKPLDKTSKDLDVKSLKDDQLLLWRYFIDRELNRRKRLINVSFNNLMTSETKIIEVRIDNFGASDTIEMHIPIPETTQSNGELVNLLNKLNENIFSIFNGEYDSRGGVCYGLFGSYLKQRCDDQTTLGINHKIKDRDRYEFVGVYVLDFIEEKLGINPNSFCPLEILFKHKNAKLVFTGNRKYDLVWPYV